MPSGRADGRENEALHGLREGKGLRGLDLRGVQGDDPRGGIGKGKENPERGREGDPPGGDPPEKVTGGAATRTERFRRTFFRIPRTSRDPPRKGSSGTGAARGAPSGRGRGPSRARCIAAL